VNEELRVVAAAEEMGHRRGEADVGYRSRVGGKVRDLFKHRISERTTSETNIRATHFVNVPVVPGFSLLFSLSPLLPILY
jgi:hypothetical protein